MRLLYSWTELIHKIENAVENFRQIKAIVSVDDFTLVHGATEGFDFFDGIHVDIGLGK